MDDYTKLIGIKLAGGTPDLGPNHIIVKELTKDPLFANCLFNVDNADTWDAPVLIGVLQKHTIKQYIRSAKTAELIAPLTEGFSDISRPVVLQIRFPKTYQGEIKHIPIW